MTTDTLSAIDALQTRYIVALDGQDMASWLDTFSTDPAASYICISAENDKRTTKALGVATGTNVLSKHLQDLMGDAPFCNQCGHTTVRNGACFVEEGSFVDTNLRIHIPSDIALAIIRGEMNASVESNPRFGPLAFDALARRLRGEAVAPTLILEDRLFDATNAAELVDDAF